MQLFVLSLALFAGLCAFLQFVYLPRTKKAAPALPDRKTRFLEYVRGEKQLMADWEHAFDPIDYELQKRIATGGLAAAWYAEERIRWQARRTANALGGVEWWRQQPNVEIVEARYAGDE